MISPLETILIAAAFGLVVFLCVLLYPRPRLVLAERGILDRQLHVGWIRWDEIEGAYPPNREDSDGLRLKLRPRSRLLDRLKRRRGAIPAADGSHEIRIDPREADTTPVEMLREVIARSQAAGKSSPT